MLIVRHLPRVPAIGQSTGHTGTQLASLQQFCVMTYATVILQAMW
ncbi:Uncharacterised protein [Mycobacteroides abscessus subsp. bolletii]|nr:Uncharacterised protein [Mycobacteroides abscessus subsp. bolletii]